MRILLVEDDVMLGTSVKLAFEREKLFCDWAQTVKEAIEILPHGSYEAVILDINLPDGSGLDILRRIRATDALAGTPVLVLTAQDGLQSKIEGLDSGADDYLTKPFEFDELMARLRSVTRRHQGRRDNRVCCRDIVFDVAACTVKVAGGDDQQLIASEVKALGLLMQNAGKVVTRERLQEALYGWDEGAESNVLEVVIYNLRKKLGKENIVTLRGIGYMIPS